MDALLEIVDQLVERVRKGQLPDEQQMVANLRFLMEQVEAMHQRHSQPRGLATQEALRMELVDVLEHLYGGLEEMEHGLVEHDGERLEAGLQTLHDVVHGLSRVERQAEDMADS